MWNTFYLDLLTNNKSFVIVDFTLSESYLEVQ